MSSGDGRLDNGRSKAVIASSQPSISQGGEMQHMAAVQLQTSPFSFDLLERFLNTHTWSTYQDENGNTTAMHVELKEGQHRFKYILGADEPNGNIVLLSKQQMLKETVGKPARALPKSSGSAEDSNVMIAEQDYLADWVQPDRRSSSSSSNGTISIDTDLSISAEKIRHYPESLFPKLYNVKILTTCKRKRLAPGSYTLPRPPRDRKRPRVTNSPGPKTEVIELDTESNSDAEQSIVEIPSDEDSVRYRIEKENASYLGSLSQELQNVNFAPRSTAATNKHARVGDWVGTSQ